MCRITQCGFGILEMLLGSGLSWVIVQTRTQKILRTSWRNLAGWDGRERKSSVHWLQFNLYTQFVSISVIYGYRMIQRGRSCRSEFWEKNTWIYVNLCNTRVSVCLLYVYSIIRYVAEARSLQSPEVVALPEIEPSSQLARMSREKAGPCQTDGHIV